MLDSSETRLAAHEALPVVRRRSRRISVGSVFVGGDAAISVQSMTNTPSDDVEASVRQIEALAAAGADIVRVSCPDEEATRAFAQIVKRVSLPLVADIHFHYKRALEAARAGAAALRINPGNIGGASRVREVVKAAKGEGCSIRIGVNAGSLERELLEKYGEPCPQAMVESALSQSRLLEDCDFDAFKISVKASDVRLAIASYRLLANACDHPLHLRMGVSPIPSNNKVPKPTADLTLPDLPSRLCDSQVQGMIARSIGGVHKGRCNLAGCSIASDRVLRIFLAVALQRTCVHTDADRTALAFGCLHHLSHARSASDVARIDPQRRRSRPRCLEGTLVVGGCRRPREGRPV